MLELLKISPFVTIVAGVTFWAILFEKVDLGPAIALASLVLATVGGVACIITTVATSDDRGLRWWRLFSGIVGPVACTLVFAFVYFIVGLMNADMPY